MTNYLEHLIPIIGYIQKSKIQIDDVLSKPDEFKENQEKLKEIYDNLQFVEHHLRKMK